MEATAKEVLPPGYTFAWSGLAFEEKKSGGTSGLAFVFGFIIVFLVLAAQYESWTLPGAVMSAVPFGILGALLTNHLRGLDNDVYFQIGLLVLIGLGAKNAVLRVSAADRLPQPGQVDHGSDDPRGRAAAAADHHDLARVRDRLPAAGARASARARTRGTRSAPASSAACSARPRSRCCTCRCSSTSSTG